MTKRLFLLLTVLSISHTYAQKISYAVNKTGTLTLGENPSFSVQAFEQAGLNLTSEMKEFHNNWPGTKVK